MKQRSLDISEALFLMPKTITSVKSKGTTRRYGLKAWAGTDQDPDTVSLLVVKWMFEKNDKKAVTARFKDQACLSQYTRSVRLQSKAREKWILQDGRRNELYRCTTDISAADCMSYVASLNMLQTFCIVDVTNKRASRNLYADMRNQDAVKKRV